MSLFLSPIELPSFFRVRQNFARPCVEDIEATVVSELDRIAISDSIQAGQTIAITCGSRGIANIPILIRTIVRYVRRCGALPFLVPAMGSHGGGTAEGQIQILDQLGITETDCECEIRASMDSKKGGGAGGKKGRSGFGGFGQFAFVQGIDRRLDHVGDGYFSCGCLCGFCPV